MGRKLYAFRKTRLKKPGLFGRYVPINGISFSPSQTLSTGLTLNDADTFVFDMKFAASTTRSLIGASTDQGTYFGMDASGRFELGGNVTIPVTTADPTQRNIVTFEHTGPSLPSKLTVNSYTIQRDRSGSATQQNPFRYPIPGYGGNGVTFYAYKAYQSGTLLCDRIAVKDTVTNEIGYFDRLTETFTAVTGTAGDLIQPLANAIADGTVTVDTELIGSEKTKIILDFAKANNTDSTMQIVGTVTATSRSISCNISSLNTAVSRFDGASQTGAIVTNTNRHTLEMSRYGYVVDNAYKWIPHPTSFTTPDTLLLCGAHSSSSNFKGNLYRAQFYEGGVLVRDYLPVRIGTTVELLDLVNWHFGNRTGTFTAGADLPPATEDVKYVVKKNNKLYLIGINGATHYTFQCPLSGTTLQVDDGTNIVTVGADDVGDFPEFTVYTFTHPLLSITVWLLKGKTGCTGTVTNSNGDTYDITGMADMEVALGAYGARIDASADLSI